MTTVSNRVAVLHGVNFDVLERRDPAIYGGLSLAAAGEEDLRLGARAGPGTDLLPDQLRGRVLRIPAPAHPTWPTRRSSTPAPGPTTAARSPTRCSWPACPRSRSTSPTVEERDDWRKLSVFDGLVLAKISGKGPDGYREALELLARELGAGS